MTNFYDYLRRCESVNVYCFDLKQYDPKAKEMTVMVMLNYAGITYNSGDIRIDIPSFCLWIEDKWQIYQGKDIIMAKGCQEIIDMIRDEEGETNG